MTNPIQGLVPTDPNQAVAQISQSGSGVDALTKLAVGNPHLVTNPGLLQALANGNATYGQASAVNAFMTGLKLQQVVEHARAVGQPQQFTDEESRILNQMHVKFDDVAMTPQLQLQKDQAQAQAQGMVVATNANGQEIYNTDGTPVLVSKKLAAPAQKKSEGGFWHGVGSVFHEIAKPFNVVSATLGDAVSGVNRVAGDAGLLGDIVDPLKLSGDLTKLATGNAGKIDASFNPSSFLNDVNSISGSTPSQDKAMRDAGYDPGNPLSIIAYRAAGKDFQDTAPLADNWDNTHPGAGQDGAPSGAAMIELAKRYLDSPGDVTRGIETDQTLSMQQRADQMNLLNSKDFQGLVAHVGASRSSIGNAALSGVIDPEAHPKAYTTAAAGIDLASAFAIDPLLVLGKATKAAKLAQVGLKGFQDGSFATRINDVLLSDTSGIRNVTQPYRANVQRGMQRFLDNSQAIRAVTDTGLENTPAGAKALANAYADIRATTPALEPLLGDFSGQTRVLMDEAGRPLLDESGKVMIGKGAPITSMEDAAQYLGSKLNFARLMSGRAAVEWNLMPGSLSAFGTRTLLKAKLAPAVGRRAVVSVGRAEEAMRVLPWANDAIDDSNRVVAAAGDLTAAQKTLDTAIAAHGEALGTSASGADSTSAVGRTLAALNANKAAMAVARAREDVTAATEGMASARRAAEQEVMFGPKMSGEIRANLLKRGTLDGTGFNPGNYLAAQAERAARRLSSFLPREQSISLVDSSSTDKVYKFLQLYTSRSDAALGAAKWSAADEGTRRAMLVGIQQQVMHAAGYGATEAGRTELDRVSRLMDNPFSAVDDAAEGHMYAPMGQDIFDEPLLGGQPVHMGVLPSHVQTEFTLPSYGQLARNAAQSALWRRTMGPMFQSRVADLMTFGFKTFQLMKPTTWTRNMVEGLGNAAFRGELGSALRAKAAAIEAGAMPERGVSKIFNPKNWNAKIADKVQFAPLAKVGQWYRHGALRSAGLEDGIDYIARLNKDELTQWIHSFSSHHLQADLDPGGLLQARGIINDGLTPQEITFNLQHDASPFRSDRPSFERQGFTTETANGMTGADRWSGNLATLINEFPEHAKVLLDAAKRGDGDVADVVAHINSNPQLANRVDSLRARSILRDDRLGTSVEAKTVEQRDAALQELARRQVSVASGMLTGRDGTYLHAVDDYVRKYNHAPSASWLMDHVPDAERPFEILAPKYVARPPVSGIDGFARAISQVTDKWYKRLVEDPIQHTTSLPVFLANYGKARYFLSDAETGLAAQIAEGRKAALDVKGLSSEDLALAHKNIDEQASVVADHLMKQQAVKMSWVRTEQIIDDPGLKTQLDVTGRNFFMYSRATQAMIRRWGQAILQDPARLEKAALALHAAEHSGMIYTDKNGELCFIYPGSAPFINGVLRIARAIPWFGNFTQLPITPDLTGKVLFAAPGLDNPFKMALSPIVNIPYRMVEAHVPAAARLNMDQFDKFVNGPIGAGQIGSLFMPTGLRNLFSAMNTDDRKSQWASSMTSAISNLIAADPTGAKGIVPGPNASPAEKDAFLARMKIQTKNILYVRYALGLFFPAPASLPTMMTAGSKADPAFAAQGLKSLRDEYQKMLNDFNGDYNQANQLWAEMHPDKLVYETGMTKSTAKGAQLPADEPTFKWMIQNDGFMTKYKATAAYFIPPSTGQFSSQAYQEELALGLRLRFTPDEFYQQVRTNQGGAVYWPSYDAYKAKEVTLKAAGDTAALKNLRDAWAQYDHDFKAANPLFTNSLDASKSAKGNAAADQLGNLREMLAHPSGLPSTVDVTALGRMVSAYDSYSQWRVHNIGGGSIGKARRDQVTSDYQSYMTGLAQSDQALLRLYTGVFRPLSPELLDLSANGA